MKNLLIAAIAIALLSACTQRQEFTDYENAGRYLDGKLVKDAEGCAYVVTHEPNIYVTLRWLPEASAETCTHTPIDAS